jgi:hypothetical protein
MIVEELAGKSYQFADGNKIEVVQVKKTDIDRGENLVTYLVYSGPGIPRKFVLSGAEFMNYYGHLFSGEDERPDEFQDIYTTLFGKVD